jgi:FkbM family methyltransferase
MKAAVNSLISNFVSMLPPSGRDAVFERLCEMKGVKNVFVELASACNVVDVSVAGEYGIIRQSIFDRAILPSYMKSGRWAEQSNEAVSKFFAASGGGTYIDVGANIGLTTIPIARNPKVQCIALEPEPNNFSYLQQNVAANCPNRNVMLKRVAAFSRHDTVSFEICHRNFGDHRIRLHNAPGKMDEHKRETIKVDAIPLDEVAPNNSGPLALKLDTEGAEPFVVTGGRNTLRRADLIAMEFWPYAMDRMGADPEEIFSLIESNFNTISYFGKNGTFSTLGSAAKAIETLRHTFQIHKGEPSLCLDLLIAR